MSKYPQRRKSLFANHLHQELFCITFLAAFIPTLITTIGLYYLIFTTTAEQIGFPEAIADNIYPAAKKVFGVLMIVLPTFVVIIALIAHKVAHTIVGPYNRIIREIDENISGQRTGPIKLRTKDRFIPLVDRINTLLDKIK